jgi:hypothetical protein
MMRNFASPVALRKKSFDLGYLFGSAFNILSLEPDIWFKADAGTFQTPSGSPATSDSDPVGEWLDQSGNARHATNTTSTERLTLKLNIQNGLPVLRADGVDDHLTFPEITVTDFTVFFVINQTTDDVIMGRLAGAFPQLRVGQAANRMTTTSQSTLSTSNSDLMSPVQGNWTTLCYQADGATMRYFQDGNARGTGPWDGPTNFSDLLGALDGAATLNGDCGEIILFPSALSSTNLLNVFGYLRRWGTP